METGGGDVEAFFLKGDDSNAGVRVDERCCSLFDDSLSIGPIDPFVDMEREIVIVGEVREEHHEECETG